MGKPEQTEGRQENEALPPGRKDGIVSEEGVERTGEESRRRAGPDGPSAAEVGDTFKKKP